VEGEEDHTNPVCNPTLAAAAGAAIIVTALAAHATSQEGQSKQRGRWGWHANGGGYGVANMATKLTKTLTTSWQQHNNQHDNQHNNQQVNQHRGGIELGGGKETMFESVSFIQRPGMT
jgi:hypothetical protein